MENKYQFRKDYQKDAELRTSFNELAKKTFCINFENWYQGGYWTEKYIPYSLLDGHKVIANISVNRMDFDYAGEEKHYIQLGTIMTDENYRNQGLSRYLMEKILEEYKEKADGIYLFANDSVLNFYPKFGFKKSTQYQYSKTIEINTDQKVTPVNTESPEARKSLLNAILHSSSNSKFQMDNPGLSMFYILMGQELYYLKERNAYVAADIDQDKLILQAIYAEEKLDLEEIIRAFGSEIHHVILGFSPFISDGYTREELSTEDTTLFVLGKDLERVTEYNMMFPTLSHA